MIKKKKKLSIKSNCLIVCILKSSYGYPKLWHKHNYFVISQTEILDIKYERTPNSMILFIHKIIEKESYTPLVAAHPSECYLGYL